MAVSEAQKRANRNSRMRQKKANPEKYKHDRLYSAVKSFIRNHATAEDLDEIAKLSDDRRRML